MTVNTAYKIKVMQAYLEGKPIEFTNCYCADWEAWQSHHEPCWSWLSTTYRVKELTKPSINWDEVSDEYNWLARDADGQVYVYCERPNLMDDMWSGGGGVSATPFKSVRDGDISWDYSLVRRPSKGNI